MKKTVLIYLFMLLPIAMVAQNYTPKLVLSNYAIPMNEKGASIGRFMSYHAADELKLVKDTAKIFVLDSGVLKLKKNIKLDAKSPIRYNITVKWGLQEKEFEVVKDEFLTNKVVAHRGAWKHHDVRQNSNGALKAAINLGCAAAEVDVWLSKDKRLALNHDHEIDNLIVEETDLAEMQKIKLQNNEVLATLEEYINIIKQQNRTRIILEFKTNPKNERVYELVELAMNMIHEMKAQAWFDFISFDYRALQTVRAIDASGHTAYLGANRPLDLQKVEGVSGIDYHFSQYNKNIEKLYERARVLGMSTNVWTVNDSILMHQFLDMGVDYITTDEPEMLLEIIRQKRTKK